MTFAHIGAGTHLFLDANVFVYFFGAHPVFGSACQSLLDRAVNGEIVAFTSTHVMSDVAHRLMTLEASNQTGRSFAKIANWLKKHPDQVSRLSDFRRAIERITLLGVQVITSNTQSILNAAEHSLQFGLLSNDALIVALMRENALTHLASNDGDFDRVVGLTRYGPA